MHTEKTEKIGLSFNYWCICHIYCCIFQLFNFWMEFFLEATRSKEAYGGVLYPVRLNVSWSSSSLICPTLGLARCLIFNLGAGVPPPPTVLTTLTSLLHINVWQHRSIANYEWVPNRHNAVVSALVHASCLYSHWSGVHHQKDRCKLFCVVLWTVHGSEEKSMNRSQNDN